MCGRMNNLTAVTLVLFKKNQMDTYGGEERCVRGFGDET
jgi:hypothetical protein